jgi:dihydrofolate reductase
MVVGRVFELSAAYMQRSKAMRTVTYGGAVSLDGFLAGVDGSIDWLHFSKDVQEVVTNYWKDVDTILMGRKTYAVAAAQGRGAEKNPKNRPEIPTCPSEE